MIDGALTNPLAHAVATALALAGATRAEDVARIETELLRANDIESDDTSCVRVSTTDGRHVVVAATLCAEDPGDPYVVVHGSRGRITYWYKQDRVLLQRAGHGPEEFEYGRTDLLENLVDAPHRRDAAARPARRDRVRSCGSSRRSGRPPTRSSCPRGAWRLLPEEDRRVVPGVDGLVAAAADTLCLYSELGAPWAFPTGIRKR